MKDPKIVLQQNPLDYEPLILVQDQILQRYPDFKKYSKNIIHMTLFHYGTLSEIYSDLSGYTDVSYEMFSLSFLQMLNDLSEIKVKNRISLRAIGIDTFGANFKSGKVVIRYENSDELMQRRRPYVKIFVDWLGSVGVSDYKNFMKKSKNFRHNFLEDFKPHVTLGFTPLSFDKNEINIGDFSLDFGDPYLHNVEYYQNNLKV